MTANHILHVTPHSEWVEWTLECIGGVGTGNHVLIHTEDTWYEDDIDDYEAQGLVDRDQCWARVCLNEHYQDPTECIPREDESKWPANGPWPVEARWDGDGLVITYAGGDS